MTLDQFSEFVLRPLLFPEEHPLTHFASWDSVVVTLEFQQYRTSPGWVMLCREEGHYMQEYDERPMGVEDEQTACHDCYGYQELLEFLNQEIAQLRGFVASPTGLASLEYAVRAGTTETSRKELKRLESRLRMLTLERLEHQRQAH